MKEMEMWLARDKDNCLFLYIESEPVKDVNEWKLHDLKGTKTRVMQLNKNSFPEVKWLDEKPTKVKLVKEMK